jgi:hypothetical protein
MRRCFRGGFKVLMPVTLTSKRDSIAAFISGLPLWGHLKDVLVVFQQQGGFFSNDGATNNVGLTFQMSLISHRTPPAIFFSAVAVTTKRSAASKS